MTAAANSHNATQEVQQVPVKKRFLWGLGGATDFLVYNGLAGLCDQVYIIGLGMRPEVMGLARSLPRLIDIVIDPAIGYLSDNTRSRWGRRRPWMFCGVVLAALISILMWYPPVAMGPVAANTFIVVMLVLLYTFGYSFFTIPYTAQGYELSTNYSERTHVFKWRLYAFSATGFLTPWFPSLCLMFEGSQATTYKGTVGIHWLSIGIAALILLTAAGPIFGCREGGEHERKPRIPFIEALTFTLRNTAFWPLVIGSFLAKFGMTVTGVFFYYVMIYYISGDDMAKGAKQWGIFCNAINLATFLAMAPIARLADRLGKKKTLMLLMLCSSIGYASVWFTLRPHTLDWVVNVTSVLHGTLAIPLVIAESWPSLITAASIGLFCNTMPLIINSMLADVCDLDALRSGHRREAFYSAVFVTCDKIAMAMTLLLQGFLLKASGFDAALNTQAPETIAYWMKALLLTQPMGFLLGFCCILFYPISRAMAVDVRRQLDQREQTAIPL